MNLRALEWFSQIVLREKSDYSALMKQPGGGNPDRRAKASLRNRHLRGLFLFVWSVRRPANTGSSSNPELLRQSAHVSS